MGPGEEVTPCLVFRGTDSHGRAVVCLQDATVEIRGDSMRRREVCAQCASDLFESHMGAGVKMRVLPRALEKRLR